MWVTGPYNIVYEFRNFAKDFDNDNNEELLLSANKFIPYPQKFIDMDKDAHNHVKVNGKYVVSGYRSGGYNWCIENWGTKWEIFDCVIKSENYSKNNSKIVYSFNSACSPITKVILAMANKYPELTFKLRYYERSMGFKGILVVKGGNIIEKSESKYHGNRGG